jgi:hypothetical protein
LAFYGRALVVPAFLAVDKAVTSSQFRAELF